MKVLHIHFGKEGGAERFFVNLAGALARRNVEQRFVIRPGRSWDEAIARHGPVIRSNGRRNSLGGFLLSRRLRRICADWRPDAVMAWMPRAAGFVPNDPHATKLARLGDFPANLKHFGACDVIVGNTPQVSQVVRDLGWPKAGVTISNFTRPVTPSAVPRSALDTPDDSFLVCGVGRFVPRKGMDLLIRATARLPDAWLWLVGDGKERAALEALVDETGLRARTRFVGWADEPIHHIAAADALGLPSRVEPLGNVALEGWHAGTPVVSTRSEGPSWFMTDGHDGLMVDIDDVDAFSVALERLRTDTQLRAGVARAGRRSLSERFGENVIVDQYLALFAGDLRDPNAGESSGTAPETATRAMLRPVGD